MVNALHLISILSQINQNDETEKKRKPTLFK